MATIYLALLLLVAVIPTLYSSAGAAVHSSSVTTSYTARSIIGGDAERAPESHETTVDEQLYSRQLLVYGKSAQRKMQDSHILVAGDRCIPTRINVMVSHAFFSLTTLYVCLFCLLAVLSLQRS